jgi:uncharacterized protein (TIGR03435 family)
MARRKVQGQVGLIIEIFCALGCLTLSEASLLAWQSASQPEEIRPQFEVASVKPNATGPRGSSFTPARGAVHAKNVTLKLLLSEAFGLSGLLISGVPSPEDRYDIEAKAAPNATRQQMVPMLRSLLVDRFKLQYHFEKRETKVFRLTSARPGTKIPPFKQGSCDRLDPNLEPRTTRSPSAKAICGIITPGVNGTDRTMGGVGVESSTLAKMLSFILGIPVVDDTHLSEPLGEFHLEYASPIVAVDATQSAGAEGPSIFTALRAQLGLQLESSRASVDFLIVDHIEKPDAN